MALGPLQEPEEGRKLGMMVSKKTVKGDKKALETRVGHPPVLPSSRSVPGTGGWSGGACRRVTGQADLLSPDGRLAPCPHPALSLSGGEPLGAGGGCFLENRW